MDLAVLDPASAEWETGLKFPRSAAGIRWARQVRDWERQASLASLATAARHEALLLDP